MKYLLLVLILGLASIKAQVQAQDTCYLDTTHFANPQNTFHVCSQELRTGNNAWTELIFPGITYDSTSTYDISFSTYDIHAHIAITSGANNLMLDAITGWEREYDANWTGGTIRFEFPSDSCHKLATPQNLSPATIFLRMYETTQSGSPGTLVWAQIVINKRPVITSMKRIESNTIRPTIFPNPLSIGQQLQTKGDNWELAEIYSISGAFVSNQTTNNLPAGIYIAKLRNQTTGDINHQKFIIK